jgi:hypothetical protein
LAITSLTSGGRSVGVVRLQTQTMEFFLMFLAKGQIYNCPFFMSKTEDCCGLGLNFDHCMLHFEHFCWRLVFVCGSYWKMLFCHKLTFLPNKLTFSRMLFAVSVFTSLWLEITFYILEALLEVV